MNKDNQLSPNNEQKPKQQKKLNINQLMYNIQSKLSLLSQDHQQFSLNQSSICEETSYFKHLSKSHIQINPIQPVNEINLPMQMFNKKVNQILNSSVVKSRVRTAQQTNKRMQINQLQSSMIKPQQKNPQSPTPQTNLTHPHHSLPLTHIQTAVFPCQSSLSTSHLSSSQSKILTSFNTFQETHLLKIKSLTYKVSFLQQKIQSLEDQNKELIGQVQIYKLASQDKQRNLQYLVEQKLEQAKSAIIQRFSKQCNTKYQSFVEEMTQLHQMLKQQRYKRKHCEDQNRILRMEKLNLQQMYKSIIYKQKQMLKIDIKKTKNQLISDAKSQIIYSQSYHQNQNRPNYEPENIQYSQIETIQQKSDIFQVQNHQKQKQNIIYNVKSMSKDKIKSKQKSSRKKSKQNIQLQKSNITKSRQKQSKQKKQKQSDKKQKQSEKTKKSIKRQKTSIEANTQQMKQQQLIPFLAKGIQQLKDRLSMK